VKLITAETAKNPTLMGRFEREARAATTIDTPHIIKMLDAGSDAASGLPFLVLEFLDGEDVQHLIKRLGPLSPDLALRIVAQACLGLSRAHDARIIHRDIKPANLFLCHRTGAADTLKVLDFGIAKHAGGQRAGLTEGRALMGTPAYLAPELFESSPIVLASGTVVKSLQRGRNAACSLEGFQDFLFDVSSYGRNCLGIASH